MPDAKTRITVNVSGVKEAGIGLKAVLFTDREGEFRILAEKVLRTEKIDLALNLAPGRLPPGTRLVVVPREVTSPSHIKRLAAIGEAPVAEVPRELAVAKRGRITDADLRLKAVRDLLPLWKAKHKVCGRVIRTDPFTGEVCGVPGATVRVLDVDFHLWWWHPWPWLPWIWLYPLWPRREEVGTVITDECGRFCVDIPAFDIDAVIRWRLRFRCLWKVFRQPRIIDAINLGIRPDQRYIPELENLPPLEPVLKDLQGLNLAAGPTPEPASPAFDAAGPMAAAASMRAMSRLPADGRFELLKRDLFTGHTLLEPTRSDEMPVLERPAFPDPIAPPRLPDDKELLESLPDPEMLPEIRRCRPLSRLLLCWPEWVPSIHLWFDVPDIVFKVEQDIDGDGDLETVYDQGYLDINWNLSQPTTNVTIEAQSNAICVPCGGGYTPCTKTGIVGISEMAVDPIYLSPAGYATRVNRPKPPALPRPAAETPICKTVRLVGCPAYGKAKFYRVFYSYEGQPETFFKESWWIYKISATATQKVQPDANGFYPVLTPPNDYFPYHTLINWRTAAYPHGTYAVRLELYNAAKNKIAPALPAFNVEVDNKKPSPVEFLKLEVDHGAGFTPLPLHCPIVRRAAGSSIQLRVTTHVAATHLRSYSLWFGGCDGGVGSTSWWHKSVNDNSETDTWTVTVPGTKDEGAYRFHLAGHSRAFQPVGGLGSNWYIDPVYIWRTNNLHVAILDS